MGMAEIAEDVGMAVLEVDFQTMVIFKLAVIP